MPPLRRTCCPNTLLCLLHCRRPSTGAPTPCPAGGGRPLPRNDASQQSRTPLALGKRETRSGLRGGSQAEAGGAAGSARSFSPDPIDDRGSQQVSSNQQAFERPFGFFFFVVGKDASADRYCLGRSRAGNPTGQTVSAARRWRGRGRKCPGFSGIRGSVP
jgi:hypothetical protein